MQVKAGLGETFVEVEIALQTVAPVINAQVRSESSSSNGRERSYPARDIGRTRIECERARQSQL